MGRERKERETRRKQTIRNIGQGKTRAMTDEPSWTHGREGERPKRNGTSLVNCPLQPGHEILPITSSKSEQWPIIHNRISTAQRVTWLLSQNFQESWLWGATIWSVKGLTWLGFHLYWHVLLTTVTFDELHSTPKLFFPVAALVALSRFDVKELPSGCINCPVGCDVRRGCNKTASGMAGNCTCTILWTCGNVHITPRLVDSLWPEVQPSEAMCEGHIMSLTD